MLRGALLKYKVNGFYRKGLNDVQNVHCNITPYPADSNLCEIICITFNNPALIKLQNSLIKKYVGGPYNFTVADNSSDAECRASIKAFCDGNRITYISLPKNPYENGSRSHAAAMNWVTKNYLLKKKPAYFGFIDHDIFPIENFAPANHLAKQPVYGLLQERDPYWYLWAGFCFFKYNAFDAAKLDFMPGPVNGTNLDTGGQNWNLIYAGLDKNKLEFPAHTYKNLRDGEVFQSDKMEIIGNWLHSFNGSYWMKVDAKEHLLEEYLQQYI